MGFSYSIFPLPDFGFKSALLWDSPPPPELQYGIMPIVSKRIVYLKVC